MKRVQVTESHDRMDRASRTRLVEFCGARDDSPSWNLGRAKQGAADEEMQKHVVREHPKDSPSWKTLEVQSLVSDPREYTIDGPMCRWSLKSRGSDDKTVFMFKRKPTRWLTMSKEIAEVLRGDDRWKRDRRYVRMTGKSETTCEYPASLVVAMLSAINLQMISDGAIRVEELHFAGLVLDEGDYSTELEGK